MAAVSSAGISWRVVRLWIGDKNVERQLKNNVRGNTGQYCPECHENPRGNAVPEWEEKSHEK